MRYACGVVKEGGARMAGDEFKTEAMRLFMSLPKSHQADAILWLEGIISASKKQEIQGIPKRREFSQVECDQAEL